MKERFLIIDFLKGYSIFAIIVYHIFQFFVLPFPLNKAIAFGGSGVHTFFLVSGFGLSLSTPMGIKYFEFLQARFYKIYLPYIIVVVVSALISLMVPIFENTSLYAFFGHIFLYKMFNNALTISFGHQLWFISTIVQFYFIFPLLLRLLSNLSLKKFITVGLIVSICWSTLTFILQKSDIRIWNSFFLQFLWEFMLGMALAKLKDKSFLVKKHHFFPLLLLSIVGVGCQILLIVKGGRIGQLFNDIPALIGFTGFAILIFNFRLEFVNKFFVFTGKISYALYLLHVLVINILIYLLSDYQISFITILALAFFVNYLMSIWYTNFIDYLYSLIMRRSKKNI